MRHLTSWSARFCCTQCRNHHQTGLQASKCPLRQRSSELAVSLMPRLVLDPKFGSGCHFWINFPPSGNGQSLPKVRTIKISQVQRWPFKPIPICQLCQPIGIKEQHPWKEKCRIIWTWKTSVKPPCLSFEKYIILCRRVGDVAEGILYEFLPSAFNAIIPPCEDPRTELTYERCKA